MRISSVVRKIDLSKFEDDTIEVKFSSTYKFKLSHVMNMDNCVKFDAEQDSLRQFIVDHFCSSFFSDAFGRIPAESFKLEDFKCNQKLEQEFESQHSAFLEEDKKRQKEKEEKAKAEEKQNRKSLIQRLKKQLTELENADKQDTMP